MLAFLLDNQVARLRQFAFGLAALIVCLANPSLEIGLYWAVGLASYPVGLHWVLPRMRVIADHPDWAFVLDTAMIFLMLATQPLGLLTQIALIGGMAFCCTPMSSVIVAGLSSNSSHASFGFCVVWRVCD